VPPDACSRLALIAVWLRRRWLFLALRSGQAAWPRAKSASSAADPRPRRRSSPARQPAPRIPGQRWPTTSWACPAPLSSCCWHHC